MSRRILKNRKFLEYYLEANNVSKEHLLKGANNDQVNSICECMLNLLNNNINLDDQQRKHVCQKLCHHRKDLNIILNKKTPLKKKKKLLLKKSNQKGGAIIPLILSTVLPLVADFLISKWRKG